MTAATSAPKAAAKMVTLFTRLGFTAAASVALVDVQGVDDLYEIQSLSDAKVATLCCTLR
jgi:hypothetical protein